MNNPPVTDLEIIGADGVRLADENDAFQDYLKQQDAALLDSVVYPLQAEITAQIDCTTCGNCCKTLMINVSGEELKRLSGVVNEDEETVKARYLEQGIGDQYIMNRMPCHFLADDKCSIYADRFAGCRAFPHLDLPGFKDRLFTVFMHYGRCPIVYNVLEQLKLQTNFTV